MRLVPVVWIALMSGCGANTAPEMPAVTKQSRATVAPQETIDISREYIIQTVDLMATRDRVWNAMLAAHRIIGIPASEMDERNGSATFLVQERTGSIADKPASTYIDCGMGSAGPRANSYRITLRISETIESLADEHTRVRTMVQAWARNPGVSSDRIECSSNGALEKRVLALIAATLQL